MVAKINWFLRSGVNNLVNHKYTECHQSPFLWLISEHKVAIMSHVSDSDNLKHGMWHLTHDYGLYKYKLTICFMITNINYPQREKPHLCNFCEIWTYYFNISLYQNIKSNVNMLILNLIVMIVILNNLAIEVHCISTDVWWV